MQGKSGQEVKPHFCAGLLWGKLPEQQAQTLTALFEGFELYRAQQAQHLKGNDPPPVAVFQRVSCYNVYVTARQIDQQLHCLFA